MQRKYHTDGSRMLPGGLVDLFTDMRVLMAGLDRHWVAKMLERPIAVDASKSEWFAHYLSLRSESERLEIAVIAEQGKPL